jgi:hypothetical protein
MTADLVPLGKYKGQPLAALAGDPEYLRWLLAQSWFPERYPKHYTLIVNNFVEAIDTPEHNRLQARFLDPELLLRVAESIGLRPDEITAGPTFERCGFDVVFELSAISNMPITVEVFDEESLAYRREAICGPQKNFYTALVALELKPTISDDYPAVLRQVKAARARLYGLTGLRCEAAAVVYCAAYSGRGATLAEVREIFSLSGVHFLIAAEAASSSPCS